MKSRIIARYDRRFISNLYGTFVSNLIYTVMQWLVLMILLWLGGSREAGVYTLATAISAPIFQFLGMQLRAAQATDQREEFSFSEYANFRLVTSSIALTITALIGLFLSPLICFSLTLMAISKFIESFSDLSYGYFQKCEEMSVISRSILIRSVAGYGVFIATYTIFRQINVSLLFLILIWTVNLFLHDLRQLPEEMRRVFINSFTILGNKISENEMILAKKCFPLGLIIGIGSLSSSIPSYFLAHYIGLESLGLYASLNYIIIGLGIVIGALNQNLLPRFSRYFSNGNTHFLNDELKKQLLIIVCIGTLMSMIFIVIIIIGKHSSGQKIFSLSYPVYFALCIYMTANLISSTLGNAVTAMRVFFGQLNNNLGGLLLILSGSVLLIPKIGILGAFLALLLASVMQIYLKLNIYRKNLHPSIL